MVHFVGPTTMFINPKKTAIHHTRGATTCGIRYWIRRADNLKKGSKENRTVGSIDANKTTVAKRGGNRINAKQYAVRMLGTNLVREKTAGEKS